MSCSWNCSALFTTLFDYIGVMVTNGGITLKVMSYHSCFLPFVYSISSNVRSRHCIAAPHETHWH